MGLVFAPTLPQIKSHHGGLPYYLCPEGFNCVLAFREISQFSQLYSTQSQPNLEQFLIWHHITFNRTKFVLEWSTCCLERLMWVILIRAQGLKSLTCGQVRRLCSPRRFRENSCSFYLSRWEKSVAPSTEKASFQRKPSWWPLPSPSTLLSYECKEMISY